MAHDRIGTPRHVSAFVRRLEDRIEELVEGHDRVALAYSGGLASTLVAMVARKRCELDCLVAGSPESADVRAANAAKQHMDYRIESILLDAAETGRIRRRLAATRPTLSPHAFRTLLPLFAVVERAEGNAWLAGFGSPRISPAIASELHRLEVRTPLVDLSAGRPLSRANLQAAAMSLGLPEEWARVSHRAPADGAGIAAFL
ncbi:MAG: hypothetical protein ACREDF_11560 [Thermoplasmata archaeon]